MTEQVTSHKKSSKAGVVILSLLVLAILVVVGVYVYPWKQPLVSPFKEKEKAIIVATIGEEQISLDELEAFKASIPQLKDLPMATVYRQLVDVYVNKRLILAQAQKMGLQDDAQVKRELKEAEDQLLIAAYVKKKIRDAMTLEALQVLYANELKHFVPQEEVHARHILVATEKEARDLIIKLRAGADFITLANQYTLDKGTQDGDLGYFTKEMMIPEFAKEAFSLPKGQFSKKPVKTAFGWHVVKVEDKRKSTPPTFEQSIDQLREMFIEAEGPRIVANERALANVKINTDLYPEPKAEPAVAEPVVVGTTEVVDDVVDEPEQGEIGDVVEETEEEIADEAEDEEKAVAVDIEVTP